MTKVCTRRISDIRVWIGVAVIFAILWLIVGVFAASVVKSDNPATTGTYFWVNPFNGTISSTVIDNGLAYLITLWVLYFVFFIFMLFCLWKAWYLV